MTQNFETSYSDGALAYIKAHAGSINTIANLLGISALGVAGSIAREITANDKIYTSAGSNWIFGLFNGGRNEAVQAFSHDTLAADYIPSLSADVSRDGNTGGIQQACFASRHKRYRCGENPYIDGNI